MIKITNLTEKRFRTTHKKDAYGNRIKVKEEYIVKRTVKTVNQGPRFGHFIIDVFVLQLFIEFIQYFLELINLSVGYENPLGLTIQLISSVTGLILLPFMYFIFEYYWQQTPGKFLTQTVVIDEYANKPDLRQIALRSLIRLVPFEALSCLGEKYSYGWHDKWAETFVVKKEELEKLKELQLEQESHKAS